MCSRSNEEKQTNRFRIHTSQQLNWTIKCELFWLPEIFSWKYSQFCSVSRRCCKIQMKFSKYLSYVFICMSEGEAKREKKGKKRFEAYCDWLLILKVNWRLEPSKYCGSLKSKNSLGGFLCPTLSHLLFLFLGLSLSIFSTSFTFDEAINFNQKHEIK